MKYDLAHPDFKQIAGTIRRWGWALVRTPPSSRHPGWCNTVGLTPRGLPELIIRDMHPNWACYFLNLAAGVITAGMQASEFTSRVPFVMPDGMGKKWFAAPFDYTNSRYTMPQAKIMYGILYDVKAVELIPPPVMQARPFTPWPGNPECPCCPGAGLAVR